MCSFCFELFRMQNSQIFYEAFPTGKGLQDPPPSDTPAAQQFFCLLRLLKNWHPPTPPPPPPILLDTALVQSCPLFSDTVLILLKSFILLDFCSPAAYVNLIFLPLTVYMYKFVSCWSKAKKLSLKKTAEKYDLYMTMWKRV